MSSGFITVCLDNENSVFLRNIVSPENNNMNMGVTFKRRIKCHLPYAGIIRSSPYSTRFQDKG